MYSQFFGYFLLKKGVISPDELVVAMKKQSEVHLKLGTLAIHEGYLSAKDVDKIIIMQTHQDKKFGELAIENGFLTAEQVDTLLSMQKPDYLLLGQILIEEGKITNTDFENLMNEYQASNKIFNLESNDKQSENVRTLINRFCDYTDESLANTVTDYITLLFNNLIRFLGSDFTPLEPIPNDHFSAIYCVSQKISGAVNINSMIDMDVNTAREFASRYAKEHFDDFNEYAKASLEDFLNLHNGLFNVNMSNSRSVELSLYPPEVHTNCAFDLDTPSYEFPVIFPFGTIHFIVSFSN